MKGILMVAYIVIYFFIVFMIWCFMKGASIADDKAKRDMED